MSWQWDRLFSFQEKQLFKPWEEIFTGNPIYFKTPGNSDIWDGSSVQRYLTQHGYHKQSHHSITDLTELIALHLMFPKLIYLAPGQVSPHCTIFFCVNISIKSQLHWGHLLKMMSKMPFRVNVSVPSISHSSRQYSLSPCTEMEGEISSYHLCKPSKLLTAQNFPQGLSKA